MRSAECRMSNGSVGRLATLRLGWWLVVSAGPSVSPTRVVVAVVRLVVLR